MSKQIFEVKLVPVAEPNHDGRWTIVKAERLSFGQVIGTEFVVQFRVEQPFYMHGGQSNPEMEVF